MYVNILLLLFTYVYNYLLFSTSVKYLIKTKTDIKLNNSFSFIKLNNHVLHIKTEIITIFLTLFLGNYKLGGLNHVSTLQS